MVVGPDGPDVGAFLQASTPSPPPPYDAVVCKGVIADAASIDFTGVCDGLCDGDPLDGLPSYEAALKLEATERRL